MLLIKKIVSLFNNFFPKPQTELERYIVTNNPKDIVDVERLSKQYDLAVKKGFFV